MHFSFILRTLVILYNASFPFIGSTALLSPPRSLCSWNQAISRPYNWMLIDCLSMFLSFEFRVSISNILVDGLLDDGFWYDLLLALS